MPSPYSGYRFLDETLRTLETEPSNKETFAEMVAACMNTIVSVLQCQYLHYLELDISEELRRETSSCSHCINAEDIMKTFSAG